ncbi:hypothetical protein WJX81_006869 [Elliptochloris bilobata]|uniref:Uncharacterized protein n=1 Tax=Elliptochloris bilobata TaxID=381761 RepID=A0AAW1RVR4_9CHLO
MEAQGGVTAAFEAACNWHNGRAPPRLSSAATHSQPEATRAAKGMAAAAAWPRPGAGGHGRRGGQRGCLRRRRRAAGPHGHLTAVFFRRPQWLAGIATDEALSGRPVGSRLPRFNDRAAKRMVPMSLSFW